MRYLENRYSPIVVFAYNRKEYISQVLNNLQKCNNIEKYVCYIFVDAPLEKDREACKEVQGFLEVVRGENKFHSLKIIYRKSHLGLKKSVITGINEIFELHDTVIDIEDDILVSPDFLEYIEEGLNVFKDNCDIWSISGHCPDLEGINDLKSSVFLMKRVSSWGFATWKDRWNKVDWSGRDYLEVEKDRKVKDRISEAGYDLLNMIRLSCEGLLDSWAAIWQMYASINNAYTVYPKEAKAINIGINGVHNSGTEFKQKDIAPNSSKVKFDEYILDNIVNEQYRSLYMSREDYLFSRDNKNKLVDKQYYDLLRKWLLLNQSGISISDVLYMANIKRIVIYGAGELGKLLLGDVRNDNRITVEAISDSYKKGVFYGYSITDINELSDNYDAIIITPILYKMEISTYLREKADTIIYSLADIIENGKVIYSL